VETCLPAGRDLIIVKMRSFDSVPPTCQGDSAQDDILINYLLGNIIRHQFFNFLHVSSLS